MNTPKRQWTPEAKKAREILAKYIDTHPQAKQTIQIYRLIDDYRYLDDTQLQTAEKYIQATLRQAGANKWKSTNGQQEQQK